jgi:hypothetical protein
LYGSPTLEQIPVRFEHSRHGEVPAFSRAEIDDATDPTQKARGRLFSMGPEDSLEIDGD